MHYHCEIILPPDTVNIEEAVRSVLLEYDENYLEEGERNKYGFWDFYVIGGRYAGSKLLASYDQEKVAAFHTWLISEGVTVSGIQCGKQELNPPSQIPKVDAKWNEMFPSKDGTASKCPIFAHSNDQYGRDGKSTIEGDIAKLGACKAVKCNHVIFAVPKCNFASMEYEGPPKAEFMLTETAWNGANHMPVKWDGTIGDALSQYIERLERVSDAFKRVATPNDDWIVVTVDYHS